MIRFLEFKTINSFRVLVVSLRNFLLLVFHFFFLMMCVLMLSGIKISQYLFRGLLKFEANGGRHLCY